MAKSVQQPRKHNLPVENKNEIVQAEIELRQTQEETQSVN